MGVTLSMCVTPKRGWWAAQVKFYLKKFGGRERGRPDLLWEVQTSPFPDLLGSFPWHLSANPLDLISLLFVFLRRVIYLLVMRSKSLSGESGNLGDHVEGGRKYTLPTTGLCCALRFSLVGLSWEIMIKWLWKQGPTCDCYFCPKTWTAVGSQHLQEACWFCG